MRTIVLVPDTAPPAARGRGATPVHRGRYEAPRPNPGGQRRLYFAFRPLAAWLADHPAASRSAPSAVPAPGSKLAYVLDLLCDYFEQVGGLRVADDAVVRAWYEAMEAQHLTPAQVRSAITEKARQLRPDRRHDAIGKRAFVPRAENFPRDWPRLLECSSEHHEALAAAARKRAREAEARKTAAVQAELEADARRRAEQSARRRADEARRVADLAAAAPARARAHWLGLGDQERAEVVRRRAVVGDACTVDSPSAAALNLAMILYPAAADVGVRRPGPDGGA